MWLKIGLLTTLFTYLYWAVQRIRRRRGCGGRNCRDCSACGADNIAKKDVDKR